MKPEIKFKALIDRIEGNIAVVLLGEEEQDAVDIPKNFLPTDIKEGDILNIRIQVKSRKTKESKEKVAEMIERLKNRSGGV